ncbi:hypothetical protein XOCgx_2396 [Xanthomonas oryzae pv. oryzicola]|nr:hypothetical protein XOCgx_2396 [Xanthomonas oryzae pv. oryzicola]
MLSQTGWMLISAMLATRHSRSRVVQSAVLKGTVGLPVIH